MKRKSNLYGHIISEENLKQADKKARKGKTKQVSVQRHIEKECENIINLHQTLKEEKYRTSEYLVFEIHRPKHRIISRLPYFPDRIIHHAICAVVNPILSPGFIYDVYSCKGKGVHLASLRLREFLKDETNTKFCLKIDIRQFYPSINHDILKSLIRRKIKCKQTLILLDEIIDSSAGLPLGNMLSQILANLYLSDFDHFIKEQLKVKKYLRYADDMLFLSGDKIELKAVFNIVQEYLKINLKLEIKSNWQIFPLDSRGIDWCGFVHYRNHTRLRKSIKLNYIKAVKKNKIKSIPSFGGWLKYSDSINLKRKYEQKSVL